MTITLTDNAGNQTTKSVTAKTESDILSSSVDVGGYVSYTPSKTSYTISTSESGYTSNQTINPSELNLWRVIRKNSDGTIDLVSEYTSKKDVYFGGKVGYKNSVGTLNRIANSYGTSGITSGSRYMGYNGQTETITDDTMLDKTTAPWTESTTATNSPKGSTRERQGGGDMLYETDTNLVKAACGNLKAYRANTTSFVSYWLASREFVYSNSRWYLVVRNVGTSGNIDSNSLNTFAFSYNDYNLQYALRPIVTLKSGITALSGDGTKNNPWKVN
jgi:hypothetical protein